MVTRTPPRSLGYQHVGTFLYLNESGQLLDSIDWWRRFLNGWQGTIETILDWGREGVQDHFMVAYRKLLEAVYLSEYPTARLEDASVVGRRRPVPPPSLIIPRRRTQIRNGAELRSLW